MSAYSYCALPSMVPRPVMAMFFAPWELIRAGTPDGQSAGFWLSAMVAPASRRSSTLSFSQSGPVAYCPGGT